MNTTIPTAAALAAYAQTAKVDTVICLVCLRPVTLATDGARTLSVVAEHRVDGGVFVACRGSGYAPARDDGRDDIRRTAIDYRRELLIQAAEQRSTMLTDAQTWTFEALTDYYGSRIIPLETEAYLWRELANHGDWWRTYTNVINTMTRQDAKPLVLAGLHNWTISARSHLLKLAEAVDGRERLAELIVSI